MTATSWSKGVAPRLSWPDVLLHAVDIVGNYNTSVTLRQLFYRLVADGTLPNLQSYYRRLSSKTAEARRADTFPGLLDRTSRIECPLSFDGPDQALDALRNQYRRDRTEGQPWTIMLGVEKAGLSEQLNAWFTDPLGIPHVALGGFPSQTLCDQVALHVLDQERPALLLYAGDHDPSGEYMLSDFERRVGVFDKVVRVALNPKQVDEYELPFNPDPTVEMKLRDDPRAAGFIERFKDLVQYEVDALPPDALRYLYQSELEAVWDADAYDAVMEREDDEHGQLGGGTKQTEEGP